MLGVWGGVGRRTDCLEFGLALRVVMGQNLGREQLPKSQVLSCRGPREEEQGQGWEGSRTAPSSCSSVCPMAATHKGRRAGPPS